MSTLLGRRLVEVQAAGRGVFEATLPAPLGAGLAELGELVRRFRGAMAKANRRGGDLRYEAVFHPVGRRGGPPHWHVVIHSARPAAEVEATIRGAVAEATGSLLLRVHFAPVRDPLAFAKYIFGATAEATAAPQLLRRFGPAAYFGNHFFGPGGLKAAWKVLRPDGHGGPTNGRSGAAAEVVEPVAEVQTISSATAAELGSHPARSPRTATERLSRPRRGFYRPSPRHRVLGRPGRSPGRSLATASAMARPPP